MNKKIGDEVWVLNIDNKIRKGEIIGIDYKVQIRDDYGGAKFGSAEVFNSEEELIESLSK